MFKVKVDILQRITDVLDRSNDAINNLERLHSNKSLYPDLKKQIQKLSDELKSRYPIDEFTNPNARNEALDKEKEGIGGK